MLNGEWWACEQGPFAGLFRGYAELSHGSLLHVGSPKCHDWITPDEAHSGGHCGIGGSNLQRIGGGIFVVEVNTSPTGYDRGGSLHLT